jgi:hypothetical protein
MDLVMTMALYRNGGTASLRPRLGRSTKFVPLLRRRASTSRSRSENLALPHGSRTAVRPETTTSRPPWTPRGSKRQRTCRFCWSCPLLASYPDLTQATAEAEVSACRTSSAMGHDLQETHPTRWLEAPPDLRTGFHDEKAGAEYRRYPTGSRSVFVGQMVFWRPGAPRPKTAHLQENHSCGPCRRRRQGQNTTIVVKMCGCLASVPQASKKPLGQKNTRCPRPQKNTLCRLCCLGAPGLKKHHWAKKHTSGSL